jgi:hypothetical protein
VILISIKNAIASQRAVARKIATGETLPAQFRAHGRCGERLRAWPIKIVGARSDRARQEWQVTIGEFFSITEKLHRGIKSRIAKSRDAMDHRDSLRAGLGEKR